MWKALDTGAFFFYNDKGARKADFFAPESEFFQRNHNTTGGERNAHI